MEQVGSVERSLSRTAGLATPSRRTAALRWCQYEPRPVACSPGSSPPAARRQDVDRAGSTAAAGAPAGEADEADPADKLRADLVKAKGRTVFAPATGAGWGAGAHAAPQKDYRASRYGIEPRPATVELRRDVERSILSACGIPPILLNHAAAGAAFREGWRLFYSNTLEPLAALMADQLSESLGTRVTLDMHRARASDIGTLARAYATLRRAPGEGAAGMDDAAARAVVGLQQFGGGSHNSQAAAGADGLATGRRYVRRVGPLASGPARRPMSCQQSSLVSGEPARRSRRLQYAIVSSRWSPASPASVRLRPPGDSAGTSAAQ